MKLRLTLASVLVALVACPAAAPHGGGAAQGYRSQVVRVAPELSGLAVHVIDGDDELELTNTGGREIVIEGYEGEPYLRFTREGIFENQRSPAAYLNDDRYANVEVPESPIRRPRPTGSRWPPASQYSWHDHRVHWMSPKLPAKVEAAQDIEHHIFDWTVPGTVDGEQLAIDGSLDYVPPGEEQLSVWLLVAVGAASLALFAGVVWFGRRLRKR